MTEYFSDIERARNITEIRNILYLIRKKYAISLGFISTLLDEYQGRHRQVGQRFIKLKEEVLNRLRMIFTHQI